MSDNPLTQPALSALAPSLANGAIVASMNGAPPPDDIADTHGGEAEPEIVAQLRRWRKMLNVAETDDGSLADDLSRLAVQVKYEYGIDENSRSEWKEKYREWLDYALQVAEEKTYPWPRASNIVYPLITVAAIQFHARAYPAIIRDRNVVKGVVIGSDSGTPLLGPQGEPVITSGGPAWEMKPGEKQDRADLIGSHMSWQLLDQQEEWEPQTDRLLVVLPIVGTMFRKSMYDPELRRNISVTVDALKMCVNYHATSFETAARKTEIIRLYPWEIESKIRAGIFLDEEYGSDTITDNDSPSDTNDPDAPTTFLEQHRRYDLDGDGYAEPWIVTIARDSGKLARLRAGWEMEGVRLNRKGQIRSIEQVAYYTKYSFIPNPESVVYDLGFGHLLYPINASVNTSLNMMFDAGHLQNAGGGFIGNGLSINTGAVRFQIGEYKPVNTVGQSIRDSVYQIPFPGPSPVLFELLKFLVDAGERVAAVKDVLTGDMPGDNTAGITTLAVIEQGLQVFTAIYKRIHRSLKYEFNKLKKLNARYLPANSGWNDPNGVWRDVTRKDYEIASVEPVSDPRMITDMQRLGRAQFLMQFANDPMFDGTKIRLEILTAANIPNPKNYLSGQPPAPPPQLMLKARELDIRERKEATELELRGAHDQVLMVRELAQAQMMIAQAENYIAQAKRLDHTANLEVVQQQLDQAKLYVDTILRTFEATAAGAGTGNGGGAPAAPGNPPGNLPGAMGGVAAPSGLAPPVQPLPAGLPAGASESHVPGMGG